MSDITDAFNELLDAQEDACGLRWKATVGAVTADCLLGDALADLLLVAGGIADAGGMEIQMRLSDFLVNGQLVPPQKLIPVSIANATDSQTFAFTLLNFRLSHGVYRLQLGDPTKDDA